VFKARRRGIVTKAVLQARHVIWVWQRWGLDVVLQVPRRADYSIVPKGLRKSVPVRVVVLGKRSDARYGTTVCCLPRVVLYGHQRRRRRSSSSE